MKSWSQIPDGGLTGQLTVGHKINLTLAWNLYVNRHDGSQSMYGGRDEREKFLPFPRMKPHLAVQKLFVS
jgi:hypothetical protein